MRPDNDNINTDKVHIHIHIKGGRGSGSSLGGLSRDGGRVRDVDGKRGGSLNRRDHGSSGLGLSIVLGGLRLSRLELGGLLLLLREDVAEEAVALDGSGLLLGALKGLVISDRGSLNRCLLSGLSRLLDDNRGNDGDLLDGLGGLLDLGNLVNSGGLSSRGLDSDLVSVLGLSLLLDLFLLGFLLLAEAEERCALAASRSALGLLDLSLSGLLNLGGLLSSGSSLLGSRDSGSGLLLGGLSDLLLLLGRLEALKSGLVGLRLGDSGGKLLGLSNLELQLGNPVIALSSVGSLKGVLVTLGGVLLVTNEEKTLASLGGPGDVRVSSLDGLLALKVVGESLGLDGVSAEEEELLGGDKVPGGVWLALGLVKEMRLLLEALIGKPIERLCSSNVELIQVELYLLGEAQALSLVVQVALLNRLGLFLLLVLLGLSSLVDGLGLLSRLLLGSGSGLGGDNGSLLDRLGLSGSLDGRGRDASGLRLGLLGDLDVLLFLGHFERFWGVTPSE
ncbi:hypothetical protein HG531_001856 [Fusarium graminearum]|nr:hypothetical protein HG531_001856 [Fusarium graminearum]